MIINKYLLKSILFLAVGNLIGMQQPDYVRDQPTSITQTHEKSKDPNDPSQSNPGPTHFYDGY